MSQFLDSVFFAYLLLKSAENKKLKIPRSKIRTGSIPVSGTKIWDTRRGIPYFVLLTNYENRWFDWRAADCRPYGGAVYFVGMGNKGCNWGNMVYNINNKWRKDDRYMG